MSGKESARKSRIGINSGRQRKTRKSLRRADQLVAAITSALPTSTRDPGLHFPEARFGPISRSRYTRRFSLLIRWRNRLASGSPVIHANRLSVVTYLSSATGQPSIPIGTLVRPASTGSAPLSRIGVRVQAGCISSEARAIGHEVARSLYDPLHRSSSQRRARR